MASKSKVLFIHLGRSSFVKDDLRILEQFIELSEFNFKPSHSLIRFLFSSLKQFFWLIKEAPGATACYCWFSDYHGLLPLLFSKIFKIPFITVLGGFDSNKIEEFNYGIFCSPWRAPIGTYIINNSTLLLPVDEHLISTDKKAAEWGSAHPNGLQFNIDHFNTPWQAIPTGYRDEMWEMGPAIRNKMVSSVALVSNHQTFMIKGWDLLIKTAILRPDFTFNLIGADPAFTQQIIEKYSPGKNVTFIPPLPRESLSDIYQSTSVYLQPSRSEGMPNVLCEAMMCGCIPIGSPVFGIPNVIGNAGYLIPKPDPKMISDLILEAHHHAEAARRLSRNQILENFSITYRTKELAKVFQNLNLID